MRDWSVTLATRAGELRLREARARDVAAIVRLLRSDELGREREGLAGGLECYLAAFELVRRDPAQALVVVTDGEEVVGTLQLTVIPGLARRGALRGQIEAVYVAESHRSSGLGTAMVTWAIDEARRRGCSLVQLTTDKRRSRAHRFYERLGFEATHEGMKLPL